MNKQFTIEISGEKIPSVVVMGDSLTVRRSVKKGFWSKRGSENRRLHNSKG